MYMVLIYGRRGRFEFNFCRLRGATGRSEANFYRFRKATKAKGNLYGAYRRRNMEKLDGLEGGGCRVTVELSGAEMYVVGVSSDDKVMAASYRQVA